MENTTGPDAPKASVSSNGLAGGLHRRIMCLPCDDRRSSHDHLTRQAAYRCGHRTAILAATELAADTDMRMWELLDMVRSLAGYASSVRVDRVDDSREFALQTVDWCNGLLELVKDADALIAKATSDEQANISEEHSPR